MLKRVASGRDRPIERLDQVRALESTVCQEIVDLVQAAGPCSVRELGALMGRRPDSLYYHVRKLSSAGLLVDCGIRGVGRRAGTMYDVPARPLRLAYEPSDPENVGAVSRVVASMLRSAIRDFRGGFRPDLAVVEGEGRNLWAARTKGWLGEEDLAEVNALLNAILEIFQRGQAAEMEGGNTGSAKGVSQRLHSLFWVLAPMDAAT